MAPSFLAWLRDCLTPSHDATSKPLPLALKGEARALPEAEYAPCDHCGVICRGAHDCPVLRAETASNRRVVSFPGAAR